jgi:probable F420-dependent oxidoreductase
MTPEARLVQGGQRRLRFGATVVPRGSRRDWVDTVRRVEASGFSVLTVMDHLNSAGVWGPLVAAYDAAPSLRVGTIVLNGDLWNPALLAREAVTVDLLTDGSLELGIGAGWDERDYRAAGIARAPASVRIARLGESLQIIRQALAGQPVKLGGHHHRIDGGEAAWPAAIQSRVPILIGGGARPILEFAAREADIVSVHRNLQRGVAASWAAEVDGTGRSGDAVAQRVGWVRDAAGPRFADLELHAIVLKAIVTADREEAVARIAAHHALSPEALLQSPHYLVGSVEQIVDDLLERRERWGISYWTVVDGNDLDALAPVIARLRGA